MTEETVAQVMEEKAADKPKRAPAKPKVKAPVQSSGKRKRAVARASLKPGKGIIRVNNQLLETITPKMAQDRIREPLILADEVAKTVDIDVLVRGGGWQGQTEAVRLAIGKALAQFDRKLKKVFLAYDRHLLVADVRYKEERKPNDSKARAARQKSYR